MEYTEQHGRTMSRSNTDAVLLTIVGLAAVAFVVINWLNAPQRTLETAIESSSKVHADMFDRHRPLVVDDEHLTVVQPPVPADADYGPGPADPYGAAETVTLNDDREELGAARWQQPMVTYSVVGDAATPQAVRDIDATYRWLSDVTGVAFHPVEPDRSADITVAVNIGAAPRAIIIATRGNGTIQRAVATWDPTHIHASRWHYEELGHTVGPLGDFAGTIDSVYHNIDQTAAAFTAHDAWLLRTLYAADRAPRSLTEAVELYKRSVYEPLPELSMSAAEIMVNARYPSMKDLDLVAPRSHSRQVRSCRASAGPSRARACSGAVSTDAKPAFRSSGAV